LDAGMPDAGMPDAKSGMKKANDTGTSKPGHRKRRMGYFVPVME
jgi:hypothetical protein